jgi:hypothetical protein
MPRTIPGLALGFAILLALIITLLGLATYGLVHEELERQIDHRIELETNALIHFYEDHGFEALKKVIEVRDHSDLIGDVGYLTGVDYNDREMGYILIDAAGQRQAGLLDAKMPSEGWSEFVNFRKPDGSFAVAQAMNSPLKGGGRLVVAADRTIVTEWTC